MNKLVSVEAQERVPMDSLSGLAVNQTGSSTWTEILAHGVARVPAPLPSFAWDALYAAFDEFLDFVSLHPEYGSIFDEKAKCWQRESGLRLQFSGYFTPYYRNRTGQQGQDKKKIVQICEPYYRWLWEKEPQLLVRTLRTPFCTLADGLMAALYSSFAAYAPLVHALREIDRSLASVLIPGRLMPPVAIRLLRYDCDKYDLTNAHVDKSALTVILNSTDPDDDPCLVFAPHRPQAIPLLSDFKPALKRQDESLVFLGAAPREAGFLKFVPASHAVRAPKVNRVRHCAIFFWLLPGIDLAPFSTAVPFLDDLGLSRP